MLLYVGLLLIIAKSQNSMIEVTFNDQKVNFYNNDLTVTRLKSIFNISEFNYLEDLSGVQFYPTFDGFFSLSISSKVFIRQMVPKRDPTVIYPSESKFLTNVQPWLPKYSNIEIGYFTIDKMYKVCLIQFKDLSLINKKRKISKVYLRMVGVGHESSLPTQLFLHRCETDWQGIVNWSQHPIFRSEPYSSLILREVTELSFYWDVTDIVFDWSAGILPNYGIVIKSNSTYGIPTRKDFYNTDAVKKPALLVYYSD